MGNIIEKLNSLDNLKLIEVVKNYRQYGYEEETKILAMKILEERGVEMKILKLRGEFENADYNRAKLYLRSFERNSFIAFIFYSILLIIIFIFNFIHINVGIGEVLILLFLFALVVYFTFLIKSFISQSKYYNMVENKEHIINPFLYFIIGMPLYVIIFFIFKKQMKEDLNSIR